MRGVEAPATLRTVGCGVRPSELAHRELVRTRGPDSPEKNGPVGMQRAAQLGPARVPRVAARCHLSVAA